MELAVTEIFYSLQGETLTAGLPSVFIRLATCNLRCQFCDTPLSHNKGKNQSIETIIKTVESYPSLHHVTVTGGEPLLQKNTIYLLEELSKKKYSVQVETNGSLDISRIPQKVRKIVDVKTPSSKEEKSFLITNINYLTELDEIKFVISDLNDYNFSVAFLNEHLKNSQATINFSPAYNTMDPKILTSLIIKDKLKVRLNLQLHKIIDFL